MLGSGTTRKATTYRYDAPGGRSTLASTVDVAVPAVHVLARLEDVQPEDVGLYLLPFAVSNFVGPLILGRDFDTWGRRQMIVMTYAPSGLLLGLTAILFDAGLLSAATQTMPASFCSGAAPLVVCNARSRKRG